MLLQISAAPTAAVALHLMLSHLTQTYSPCRSLRDFGIGKSSIAEGGVGLFILLGGAAAIGLAAWAKGTALRKGQPYMATIEFPLACGITVGTPVRIRGVAVGSVHNVKPSLDRVDVLCEVGLVVHNVMHNLSPIQRPAVIL